MNEKEEKINILIVDDFALLRDGIKELLSTQEDFKVVGVAENGKNAIKMIKELKPQIILMDIEMPEMSGFEATIKIKNLYPEIYIIMLTAYANKDEISKGLKSGATGFLSKDLTPEKMYNAIRLVAKGGVAIQEELMPKFLESFINLEKNIGQNKNILTLREKDVLLLVEDGLANKIIAETLFISEKTVKNHLHNIYEKLGVKDRIQAIKKAKKEHFI